MAEEFGRFFLIGGLAFAGLLVFAVVYKMIEVNRSRSWRATSGKVVTSKVQARQKGFDDRHPQILNYPHVVYEYKVDNKRYRSERISIGEMAGNVAVEETLARYPVGREVEVYYNPAKPSEAVLERELPPDFRKGISTAMVIFLGGALALFLLFTDGVDIIRRFLPAGKNPLTIMVLAGMGVFAGLLAFALRRQARATGTWHDTDGEIITSEMESYQAFQPGYSSARTRYRPNIVYQYQVNGQHYTSNQVSFGAKIAGSAPIFFKGKLAKYPQGSQVRVFYNPQNPAESVLERRVSGGRVLWLVAGALLLLAAMASGWV